MVSRLGDVMSVGRAWADDFTLAITRIGPLWPDHLILVRDYSHRFSHGLGQTASGQWPVASSQ